MSYSADDRLKIIEYSYKHGIDKTLEALELDSDRKLSRRTLIRWRNKWKTSQEQNYGTGNLYYLRDKSRKPKNYRQSSTSGLILQFIQRTRLQYPTLGKDKLKVLVDRFVNEHNQKLGRVELKTISTSTVGRILASFKKQRIIPNWNTRESKKVGLHGGTGNLVLRTVKRKKPKTRRKDYKPTEPGDLVQVDCVTYIIKRVRRYLICGVDLKSRFSFAYSYDKLSSTTAKDFITKFQEVFPYPIKHVQTDNGQEFHKYFENYLKKEEITHFWNYPRSPKMNTYIERFNRTIQEEYANYKQWELKDNLIKFNTELINWLIFYNFNRPHLGLKKDTGQFISPMQYMKQYHQMCHMRWTGTQVCLNYYFKLS
jgi:transposase InsO family protein